MGIKERYTVIKALRGFVTFCRQRGSVWRMKGVLEAEKRKSGSILSKQREFPAEASADRVQSQARKVCACPGSFRLGGAREQTECLLP